MAPLDIYRKKRDFTRTSEPSGSAERSKRASGSSPIYVVHKHAATRLHYDLRLEHDGVLMSWAVTRGPSLDPDEKRLAVHVEDHPIDYAPFEGNIPKGEYGGGTVIVWDEGTWEPEGDVAAAIKKGHLAFTLHGDKLTGAWHLVRLKPRRGEKRDNWLLIKSDDEAARPGEDVLADAPRSVKSDMTIEEVGEQSDSVWHSDRDANSTAGSTRAAKGRGGRSRAAKSKVAKTKAPKSKDIAPTRDFIPPALATLQKQPPAGPEWLHEVKFDGYRMQAHIEDSKVRLLTRRGLDWTDRFGRRIAEALGALDCRQAVIDGEVVVLGANGTSSFSALQKALSEDAGDAFVYYVFDLLHLDGEDTSLLPLAERKSLLQGLLGDIGGDGPLRYSEHFHEPGRTMLTHACRMGLEGVISKRADAPYRSGRGPDWIKSKCTLRQEFVIGGYLPSDKTGRGLRSLLVGFHEDGKLRYAGRVGTGFSTRDGDALKKRLDALQAERQPFDGAVPDARKAIWVKPDLTAEIEFRAWTGDRILRHASFQGLREDKPAGEVVIETPAAPGKAKAPTRRGRKEATSVELSHPEKVYWPGDGVTKQALLGHYEAVWPRMETLVVNRPLALVRAPDGIEGQRFFQKHASPGMHKAIRRMRDPEDGEEILYIDDFDGLAALVQYGVLEIHLWGARIETIEKPDQMVFDLDPDDGVGLDAVRAATQDVRERLEELGLQSFLKTSGGKGFHVVVPLKPSAGWAEVKSFAHDFARAMEQAAPDRYTATLSKKARKGRIFLDYLRNGRGSTTVAPYSTRARAGAPVSVPIDWSRLTKDSPAGYAVGSDALARALKRGDPWDGFFEKAKPLRVAKS